jgi:hypothetical protein
MPEKKYPTSEIVRRGKEIYERDIRAQVESEHHGKYLAVDVDSGLYAIGPNSLTAIKNLHLIKPDAVAFMLRVGYPAASRIGGRWGRKS